MASTYLQRTQGSATNRKKMTLSMWFKTSESGIRDYQLWETYVSPSDRITMYIDSSDQIHWYDAGASVNVATNRKFRDCNGWYHIVWQIDTTESTASNRIKLYVNGVQETSFSEATYYSLDVNTASGTSSYTNYIGKYGGNTNNDFNGSMSHINYVDGTAYDATAFGEYDANGVWKIIVEPSVTYGTNGYFILKNGNSVTDQSGNSNNFTVGGGTLTKTEDSPSNVFATLNPLVNGDGSYSLTNGNNKFTGTGGNDHTFGTIGAIGGKFYYETKWVTNPDRCFAGFVPAELAHTLGATEAPTNDLAGLYRDDYLINVGNVNEGAYTNVSAGDIFGFAIDLSSSSGSRTLKVYKNGSLIGTMTLSTSYENDTWLPCVGDTSSTNGVIECNFGNGYFGTTAVSSAGTNASGIGIFEHDVPTGYTALSTKGLNL